MGLAFLEERLREGGGIDETEEGRGGLTDPRKDQEWEETDES